MKKELFFILRKANQKFGTGTVLKLADYKAVAQWLYISGRDYGYTFSTYSETCCIAVKDSCGKENYFINRVYGTSALDYEIASNIIDGYVDYKQLYAELVKYEKAVA